MKMSKTFRAQRALARAATRAVGTPEWGVLYNRMAAISAAFFMRSQFRGLYAPVSGGAAANSLRRKSRKTLGEKNYA